MTQAFNPLGFISSIPPPTIYPLTHEAFACYRRLSPYPLPICLVLFTHLPMRLSPAIAGSRLTLYPFALYFLPTYP